MKLKYVKAPLAQNRVNNEVPFSYSEKIKPIVLKNTILNPDFHNFGLCFSQMQESYWDDKPEIEHLDEEIQITEKESLLYLSIAPSIFIYGKKIEKMITPGQSCEVPRIIDMFTKEEGFKDLTARTKEHIVTYGYNNSGVPDMAYLNGWGLVLNYKGEFSEGCLNIPMLDFLSKYFQIKGGFIGENKLKGLDYHLGWEKYNDLLK